MNGFGRRLHLQAKFRLVAVVGLLIWLSNISIVYFEIRHINQAVFGLEQIEDLYNAVLEVRRYEKNYLLYQGRDNLLEIVGYLKIAQKILSDITDDRKSNSGLYASTGSLAVEFREYEKIIAGFQLDNTGVELSEETQETIRSVGKRMVDLSHEILKESRGLVTTAARNALRGPLISMGLILFLFIAGAFLINRKVVLPLVKLEQATKKIGRGDFSPIPHSTNMDSEVDRLTLAFNRMLEELEARHEQIIHSRKIASLGTLVSGVAHELNNPINNIILTIDSLVGGRKITPERQSALLDDILQQAIRASGIVKNLLDFSRAESSVFKDLDLGQVLRETLTLTNNQIVLNNVQLYDEIEPELPLIRGNWQGLQQVFINLLTNAVQAMPNGGELRVKAFVDKNKWICISVQDTGQGIPEEHLSRIFDPFFTTKEVGQGTGMGLSVSHGIIQKHGGRITVDSRPGKGSTFTLYLPIVGETIIE